MGASDACQRDRRWTVIATYSPTTPPAVDAIATGSCLMMPSVMPDSREPVPTSSGFAISRRGRPGELAATCIEFTLAELCTLDYTLQL